MIWKKKGLIIAPNDPHLPSWGCKRLMLPTPILLSKKVLRIYLGFCAEDNIGRVGFIDVNPQTPSEVLNISQHPVFSTGTIGSFDDMGVVPTCICKNGNDWLLFYGGFSKDAKNPYYMFEGLAISHDDGLTFTRVSSEPVLKKIQGEELFRVGSFVLKNENSWQMWYIGGNRWRIVDGKKMPVYTCNTIRSDNIYDWTGTFSNCLQFESDDEHGFSRPWVVRHKNVYQMFYSIRKIGVGYIPGYAESKDGETWVRKDNKAGIKLSASGWDSEMITYPSIISINNRTFYFYSGNNNGEGGLGYAELISE